MRSAGILFTLVLIVGTSFFAPTETTLGERLRLIYIHGTWAWAGNIAFLLSALCGIAALLTRKDRWHRASQALVRAGLSFLLTMLPMSLVVMQVNWGGLYLDEPRWRIPFTFAVTGLALQLGLHFVGSKVLQSALNIIYGVLLWWTLSITSNVLHPDSAVSASDSSSIQVFFGVMMALMLVGLAQVAWWWYSSAQPGVPISLEEAVSTETTHR